MNRLWFGLVFVCLFLVACGDEDISGTPVEIVSTPLIIQDECQGQFVAHELDHITTNQYVPVDMYDSNGAGLAVNDLDGDGDMDIVLANLAGINQIFWNEGDLNFRKEALPHGSSRGVAIVDVDADGQLDIVFTTRVGSLSYFHNEGDGTFADRQPLPGVGQKAYTMAWGDVDKDGDLDLVTGSYDTALEKELRDAFMFGNGAGVFYYENQDGVFVEERLAETSQALALQLLDLNEDGRLDILVGNDFNSVRDMLFLQTDSGWEEADLFATTTQNTMSFDVGDVNNDGVAELFAADMHPYSMEGELGEAWLPVEEEMMQMTLLPGDPQVMANVLQVRGEDGTFQDSAESYGINATGWSWSSKFGDLDQDGFLDLYSVNGMITEQTFGHMPNSELVEENQVLQNGGDGDGRFVEMPAWKLNQTGSGRGMSMADLDGDGDLDIIINNLLSSAQILENQLCEGNSLLVDLRWQDSPNPFGIGATLILHTNTGDYTRDMRVNSGYLSGDPAQIHFGFPENSKLDSLEIIWSDGERSVVEGMAENVKLTIIR